MSETILETRGLTFAYRDEPVLRGVRFAVSRGDFMSVIGSNGAGKSTLLKLLLGELEPDEGEIFLMGKPLRSFHEWRRIGYVPQNGAGLADGFPATAAEVAEMGLYGRIGPVRLPGRAHRRLAREALALVGMEAYADRMVGRLSGGQIQRVLIARALAAESELLLLDEPATGVDAGAADALYELLDRLNRERGMTVLMVTHDLQRVAELAARTLCLERGTVVELDCAQLEHELAHRHKH